MKPYNKDFLLKELDKYNNLICERQCGNYSIVKSNIEKVKMQGYMYKEKEYCNTNIIELIINEAAFFVIDRSNGLISFDLSSNSTIFPLYFPNGKIYVLISGSSIFAFSSSIFFNSSGMI